MKRTIQFITVLVLIILAYFVGSKSKKENSEVSNTLGTLQTISTPENDLFEVINPYDIYTITGEDAAVSYYAINSNILQSGLDSINYSDIETGETFLVDVFPLEDKRRTIEKNGYRFSLFLKRDQSKRCRGGSIGSSFGIKTGKRKTWYHAIISACKDGKYPLIEIAAGKGCRTPLVVDYPMYRRDFPKGELLDCGIGGKNFRVVPSYKSAFHFGFVVGDCSYNLSQLAGLEFRIKYQGDPQEYSFKALDFYPNLTEIMLNNECPDRAWKRKSLETLKKENPRHVPYYSGGIIRKQPNFIEN